MILIVQVTFTVDIRAIDDMGREAILYELSKRIHQICDRRSVLCIIDRKVRKFPPDSISLLPLHTHAVIDTCTS